MEKPREILNHYGREKQILQTVEEMAELSVELIKSVNRNKNNAAEVVNEIADVKNMLNQMMIVFNIKESDLKKSMEYKLDRQIKRIEKNY